MILTDYSASRIRIIETGPDPRGKNDADSTGFGSGSLLIGMDFTIYVNFIPNYESSAF